MQAAWELITNVFYSSLSRNSAMITTKSLIAISQEFLESILTWRRLRSLACVAMLQELPPPFHLDHKIISQPSSRLKLRTYNSPVTAQKRGGFSVVSQTVGSSASDSDSIVIHPPKATD
jgi:hypothetical protein